MRYTHTNIVSTDWKKLADFYVNTFNCEIVPPLRKQSGKWLEKGTGLQNARLEGVHLLLPGYGKNGPTLEIYQYEQIEKQASVAPNKRGFGHIAFEVENVAMILNELEKNGGKSSGDIIKQAVKGVGEITFIYARDPEGNLIELQSWE